MTTPLSKATLALTASLAMTIAAPVLAQAPGAGTGTAPAAGGPPAARPGGLGGVFRRSSPPALQPTPSTAAAPATELSRPSASTPATRDSGVELTNGQAPEPIALDQLGQPTIALPDGPIEPYLIRKENGPFMVMARTFRGPDATRYAQALVLELRNSCGLPAYIFHLKIQPGGSNIRNVQPTAPETVRNGDVAPPERYRVFDEAAVLVGDCKTIDDAESLLKKVKKLKPQTLEALPTIWGQRKGKGLQFAFVTQNPLQSAQNLYPGFSNMPAAGPNAPMPAKPGETFDPYIATASLTQTQKTDPLVKRMNGGPRSVYKCPGPYTLQVAEFTGRTSLDPKDAKFNSESFLRKSPLATAADDAESLAATIAKCQKVDPAFQPYVYHDRFGSKVCMGSFTGPDDPRLAKLRQDMPFIIGEMFQKGYSKVPLAPANTVMAVPRP